MRRLSRSACYGPHFFLLLLAWRNLMRRIMAKRDQTHAREIVSTPVGCSAGIQSTLLWWVLWIRVREELIRLRRITLLGGSTARANAAPGKGHGSYFVFVEKDGPGA